jgi:hypothetical protein
MPAGRPRGQPKTGGRKPGTPNKATTELQGLARQYTEHAIKTLAIIMVKGESEMAKIAAARELLDRGHGKATQVLAGDAEHPLQFIVMTGVPRPETGD